MSRVKSNNRNSFSKTR